LTRATGDGLSGDSTNATKTFVDANISISPQTDSDPIGDTHVLTVHVNVNPGTGFVNAPDLTTVNLTLTNSGGASATFTTGPGTGTNATSCTTSGGTGTCTASIRSTTTGTTTIVAMTTVTVGGLPVTRSTGDGLPGDSPPATKTWTPTPTTTATNQEFIPQDSATVSAAFGTPTGTVTFQLFQDSSTCSGTPVYSQTVTLNGGSASTSNSGDPNANGGFTARGNHTWYWSVTYSGDGNTNPNSSCVESTQIAEVG